MHGSMYVLSELVAWCCCLLFCWVCVGEVLAIKKDAYSHRLEHKAIGRSSRPGFRSTRTAVWDEVCSIY
jgi:hypothetical protein